MNPGEFDTKVSIQRPSFDVVNAERIESFAELSAPWCKFTVLKGREFEQAQQIVGECDVKFTTYYHSSISDLGNNDKVVIGSVGYDIQSAIPTPAGRPVYLDIYAKTRTSDDAE